MMPMKNASSVHEKRGQSEKGNDEAERARDRVAIDDDGRAEIRASATEKIQKRIG